LLSTELVLGAPFSAVKPHTNHTGGVPRRLAACMNTFRESKALLHTRRVNAVARASHHA